MPAVKNESPTPAAPKPEAERTVLVVVKPFTHAALSGEKGGFSLMPGQAFTGREAEAVVATLKAIQDNAKNYIGAESRDVSSDARAKVKACQDVVKEMPFSEYLKFVGKTAK